VELARSFGLFGQHMAFKTTASPAAGRALVRALDLRDETARTLAGMFLVKNGRKSLPYLREALAVRHNVAIVLQIIADIGANDGLPDAAADIEPFTTDPDPAVARAAHDALETLSFAARR
jgi:hypothetical protein